MNLYNQLHGENPDADKLLAILNLERSDFPRYRDIWLPADGTKIIVTTRHGGPNRQYFQRVLKAISQYSTYIRDYDDDYDDTYAYIEFSIPSRHRRKALMLAEGSSAPTIKELFEATNAEFAAMTQEEFKNDPRNRPIRKWFDEQIAKGNKVMRFYDDDMPKELQL